MFLQAPHVETWPLPWQYCGNANLLLLSLTFPLPHQGGGPGAHRGACHLPSWLLQLLPGQSLWICQQTSEVSAEFCWLSGLPHSFSTQLPFCSLHWFLSKLWSSPRTLWTMTLFSTLLCSGPTVGDELSGQQSHCPPHAGNHLFTLYLNMAVCLSNCLLDFLDFPVIHLYYYYYW